MKIWKWSNESGPVGWNDQAIIQYIMAANLDITYKSTNTEFIEHTKLNNYAMWLLSWLRNLLFGYCNTVSFKTDYPDLWKKDTNYNIANLAGLNSQETGNHMFK